MRFGRQKNGHQELVFCHRLCGSKLPCCQFAFHQYSCWSAAEKLSHCSISGCFFHHTCIITPLKTSMETENEGLEDDFPFKRAHFQVCTGHFLINYTQLTVVACYFEMLFLGFKIPGTEVRFKRQWIALPSTVCPRM